MSNLLLKTNNLCKKYGKKNVLNNINIEINQGEIIGIVGPNGSGKTTLIEIIGNIIPPTSGEVIYAEDFKIDKQMGIQFQEGYWPKGVTSRSIIKYFIGYFTGIQNNSYVKDLISIFEIEEFIDKDLNSLSGGQKQRLNALLAIIKNPKLIILDELITSLDSKMQKKLNNYFKTVVKNDDEKTIITITHIPEEVQLFCDRLILISQGEIFYQDTVKNIMNQYGSVRNFLDEFYDKKVNKISNTNINALKQESPSNKIKLWFTMFIYYIKNLFDFKHNDLKYKCEIWGRNFILLFISTFKNFRTYIYVIVLPILLSLGLYYLCTYTQPAMFPPSRVSGFMLIPSFSIILLMNTLVSEWKASIFLKRIKVSGTSKTQFLSSIWAVGIVLGMLSFFLNLFAYMGFGWFETYGYDWIYQALDSFGTSGYLGLILAALLITIMSMGMSTLIAGSISSIAISQSVAIIITILFIALSDVVLPTTIIGGDEVAVIVSYFIPTKHATWISIIMANHADTDWANNSKYIFNTDDALAASIYNFSFTNIVVPILTSLAWITALFIGSLFSFRWSQKK